MSDGADTNAKCQLLKSQVSLPFKRMYSPRYLYITFIFESLCLELRSTKLGTKRVLVKILQK